MDPHNDTTIRASIVPHLNSNSLAPGSATSNVTYKISPRSRPGIPSAFLKVGQPRAPVQSTESSSSNAATSVALSEVPELRTPPPPPKFLHVGPEVRGEVHRNVEKFSERTYPTAKEWATTVSANQGQYNTHLAGSSRVEGVQRPAYEKLIPENIDNLLNLPKTRDIRAIRTTNTRTDRWGFGVAYVTLQGNIDDGEPVLETETSMAPDLYLNNSDIMDLQWNNDPNYSAENAFNLASVPTIRPYDSESQINDDSFEESEDNFVKADWESYLVKVVDENIEVETRSETSGPEVSRRLTSLAPSSRIATSENKTAHSLTPRNQSFRSVSPGNQSSRSVSPGIEVTSRNSTPGIENTQSVTSQIEVASTLGSQRYQLPRNNREPRLLRYGASKDSVLHWVSRGMEATSRKFMEINPASSRDEGLCCLWNPSSHNPATAIGDIGYLDNVGRFQTIFNIRLTREENQMKGHTAPDSHYPCQALANPHMILIQEQNSLVYIEGDAKRDGAKHGTIYTFTCKTGPSSNCAIIVMPSGAEVQKIDTLIFSEPPVRKYFSRHALSWYTHARTMGHRVKENGSLFLITQTRTARTWGMAVYRPPGNSNARSNSETVTFRKDPEHDGIYIWDMPTTNIITCAGPTGNRTVLGSCVNVSPSAIWLDNTIWNTNIGQTSEHSRADGSLPPASSDNSTKSSTGSSMSSFFKKTVYRSVKKLDIEDQDQSDVVDYLIPKL